MDLDTSKQYIYSIGSDNQHRIFWDGTQWRYEFLAGSVIFDEQSGPDPQAIAEIISYHGLTLDKFNIDERKQGQQYSDEVRARIKKNQDNGFDPCPKHGHTAKNDDGTCEACQHPDYFDDFKGQEG